MMRFPTGRVVLGVICMLLIASGQRDVVADEVLVKRFLEEAPLKWQKYKHLLHGFEQQYDALTELISKKTEDRARGCFVCGTDSVRACIEGSRKMADQKENATVSGSNPDYDFELRKSAGSKEAFSIYDVTPHQTPEKVGSALSLLTRQAGEICRAYILDFSRFIASPDFRVLSATEVVRDGDRLVKIEFAYHLKSTRQEDKFLVGRYSGTVFFSPDSYWAITEAHVKMEDDPFKEVSAINVYNKIEKALRGTPVIVESRILWYDLKGNLIKRNTIKREWKEYTGGKERFTLSAYGFPEPNIPQPSKRWLWILGISVALSFFFIVLFIYRRWRRA